MLTLRLRDCKTASAKAAGLCSSDTSRVADYVNRAQQRLLYSGKFKGTTQSYRICTNDGCLTWPREIETIEALSVCDSPATIRSEWYELLSGGPGMIDDTSNLANTLIDRGEGPTFDEVKGTGKKIAIYPDVPESAGKYVTIQYYDQFGQWVRTQFNGAWIDGEKIAISTTPGGYNYSSREVAPGGVVRVFKDETNGVIRMYEYAVASGAIRPLGYYQPDETVPSYRRSLIPCLTGTGSCSNQTVTVNAKLRFIPCKNDDDFLMISHPEAVRLGVSAVKYEEDRNWQDAVTAWGLAERCLVDQLYHYKGSGEVATIRTAPSNIWGGGIESVM